MMLKNSKKIILLFFVIALFFIISIPINADSNDDINNIPAPPENGPSVNGNYTNNGSSVEQLYRKYNNVQVISDGKNSDTQTMWWKNRINVMKPFVIKFYAYVSPTQDTRNSSGPPADGITFTLQNDPNGNQAIGNGGQYLGVYGNYSSPSYSTPYIQNAFSYEFDPYLNSDGTDAGIKLGDYFNQFGSTIYPGIRGEHTAFTTTDPSSGLNLNSNVDPNFYSQNHYDTLSLFYLFQLTHNGSSDINDYNNWLNGSKGFSQKWHQFTYTWTPDLDQGTGTATVHVDNAPPQTHTINIQQILSANQGNPYVWWGFTGSTGADSMIAAIADTEVTGDPGITKLVLNLSKLSNDDKKKIDDQINKSNYGKNTVANLKNCIDHPSDSLSDPDLSNKLVKIIDSVNHQLFHSIIGSDDSNNPDNSNVGDVLLYKVSIYNYKVPDKDGKKLGNDWNNVTVNDNDLKRLGMRSLDGKENISANYDTIPATDINSSNSGQQPSSVGLRTIITSKNDINNPRSNTVTATGNNFLKNNNINGTNVNRSSEADVYVNRINGKILPRIVANNKITDITQKETSESNTINNVYKNDQINYNINLNNIVENSQTDAGSSYSFWVPSLKNNNVDNIKVNNQIISNNSGNGQPYYKITDNYNDINSNANNFGKQLNNLDELNGSSKKLITIYNLNPIRNDKPTNINANITLGRRNPTNFSSYPIFNDYKNGMHYVQKQETYNFSPGSLGFKYIRDIDYGLNAGYLINGHISPLFLEDKNDRLSYRYHVNENNAIAQIIDSRVNKTPYFVWLSQVEDSPVSTTIGIDSSPFSLTYFDNGEQHNISPIPNISHATTSNSSMVYKSNIHNSDNNDITSNINWNRNNELELGGNDKKNFHTSSDHSVGIDRYNANLNWTFTNAPS